MRSLFFLLLMIMFTKSFTQNVKVIKITDLKKRIQNNSDTTYIVNFWASWCAPCVKELPDFDSINSVYKTQKVKVLLVSLDFKEDLTTKLLPFMIKKNIRAEVMLLDEANGNYFIPEISEQWSGAIPGTLIVNNKNKLKEFYEKKLNYDFLKNKIESQSK